jgi:signal transduction histidine kinase
MTPAAQDSAPASRIVTDSRRSLLLATLAFAGASAAVASIWGWSDWLRLSLRLWLAYTAALAAILALQARRSTMPPLTVLLPILAAAAALGAVAGLPLAGDFLPERLRSASWVAGSAVLPFAFAVLMIAPVILLRWRTVTRYQKQLAAAEQRRQVTELEQQLTLARLQALQAQIEPHFLYNTLTGLDYLIAHDADKARQMLQHLHTYLRRALPEIRGVQCTVAGEFDLARAYLDLMQCRLGERLRYSVRLDPAVAGAELPPLMLGTLVENAVKHGVEPLPRGATLWLEAQAEDDQLRVRVSDDGAGFGASGGTGMGLSNLQARLRGLYGAAARLHVAQRAGGGVCAEISLPLRPAAARADLRQDAVANHVPGP